MDLRDNGRSKTILNILAFLYLKPFNYNQLIQPYDNLTFQYMY